ncbi:MAG: hypothetical protein HYY06_18495 [Deltaproteobacteria bacterium]|nr:hypothetical protein [Deltaproteobacteria bacterium]
MKPHGIVAEALAELDEAAVWYEEQRAGLGAALIAEYRDRLALALEMPKSGSPAGATPGGSEIRRFRLERFSRYAILLATIRGIPTVLAFEHSSRRPGYWRVRLG